MKLIMADLNSDIDGIYFEAVTRFTSSLADNDEIVCGFSIDDDAIELYSFLHHLSITTAETYGGVFV